MPSNLTGTDALVTGARRGIGEDNHPAACLPRRLRDRPVHRHNRALPEAIAHDVTFILTRPQHTSVGELVEHGHRPGLT